MFLESVQITASAYELLQQPSKPWHAPPHTELLEGGPDAALNGRDHRPAEVLLDEMDGIDGAPAVGRQEDAIGGGQMTFLHRFVLHVWRDAEDLADILEVHRLDLNRLHVMSGKILRQQGVEFAGIRCDTHHPLQRARGSY